MLSYRKVWRNQWQTVMRWELHFQTLYLVQAEKTLRKRYWGPETTFFDGNESFLKRVSVDGMDRIASDGWGKTCNRCQRREKLHSSNRAWCWFCMYIFTMIILLLVGEGRTYKNVQIFEFCIEIEFHSRVRKPRKTKQIDSWESMENSGHNFKHS